jgi:hypothetical protein
LRSTPKLLLLGTLVGVLLFALPGPAAAKGPACWKTLINDWYDGRIDNVYAVACYRDALKHLPEDVQTYSSARDDIQAALETRLLAKSTTAKGKRDRNALPVAPGKGNGGGPKSGPGRTGPGGKGPGRKDPDGLLPTAIKHVGPKDATSIPIPLIVLAGIAGLLLLAGAGGFAARRIQARRLPVQGRPPTPESRP